MIPLDEDALNASVNLIGRSGARDLEIGYANDDADAVADADWYAVCSYKGAKLMEEHHRGPVAAVEALARRVLTGAVCTHCGGVIALSDAGALAYLGSPMADGSVMTAERARAAPLCRWRRLGDRWERGCKMAPRRAKRKRGRR